jgi:hypothetical protein
VPSKDRSQVRIGVKDTEQEAGAGRKYKSYRGERALAVRAPGATSKGSSSWAVSCRLGTGEARPEQSHCGESCWFRPFTYLAVMSNTFSLSVLQLHGFRAGWPWGIAPRGPPGRDPS